jgi:GT2 family glycosyltransferase
VEDDGQVLRQVRKPEYTFEVCFAEWFHLGVSTLHRRALHDTVGVMDENWQHANDYEWYLRMAEAGARFVHVPKVLYFARFHGHGPDLDQESVELAVTARARTTNKGTNS